MRKINVFCTCPVYYSGSGEYNLTFPPPLRGGGKEFSSGKRIQEKREKRKKKEEKEKGKEKRERKRGKEGKKSEKRSKGKKNYIKRRKDIIILLY